MALQHSGQMWRVFQTDDASAIAGRELGTRVAHVAAILLFSFAMTAMPVATHFVSPVLAIVCQFLLTTMMVLYFTSVVPMAVFVALLFQNFFVSLFSGFLTTSEDYNFVRGYNFLTMMISWLWLYGHYALNWRKFDRQSNRIMTAGLVVFFADWPLFAPGDGQEPRWGHYLSAQYHHSDGDVPDILSCCFASSLKDAGLLFFHHGHRHRDGIY